eukprot:2266633-Alexandrium_andersonii.AAC.1
MNDACMKRCRGEEMFRRYCGLMGRDPTLQPGAPSRAGSVALRDWRSFYDQPPPRHEGAQSLEKDNEERNNIMNKYGGSGSPGDY